jgi:hypothetical protein
MSKHNPYMNYSYSLYGQPRSSSQQGETEEGAHGPSEHDSFDSYNDPAPRARMPLTARKTFMSGFTEKLRSPIFSTALLLGAGVAFAAIIVASYPDGSADDQVPVIKADTLAFKDTPDSRGGMDVPNQDSTVFILMRDGQVQDPNAVDNLLAQDEAAAEEPVDKLAALSEDVAETPATPVAETEPAAGNEEATPAPSTIEAGQAEKPVAAETPPAATAEASPKVQKIVQKSENITPKALIEEESAEVAKPRTLHPAGSSPETLAYVRSVLEKKDGVAPANTASADRTAEQLAAVEPAAGAATNIGAAIAPGDYFVQLASVTSESGAGGEWLKLQKSFGVLQNVDYRVERADLGERGVYYRIQAGPMSKDSANALCASIKAQKPGGCLVVK